MAPRLLRVVLHIPKTGGTTLRSLIHRRYPEHQVVEAYDSPDVASALADRPGECGRAAVLMGHFRFVPPEEYDRPCRYFTILRDPVARVVSNYKHICRSPKHPLHPAVAPLGLPAFARSAAIEEGNNLQTRLLAGMAPGDGPCEERHLEAAMQRVESLGVRVGFLHRFDESLVYFAREGLRTGGYVRENVGGGRGRARAGIGDGDLEAVADANSMDMRLYAWAAGRYGEELQVRGLRDRGRLLGIRVGCVVRSTLARAGAAVRYRVRRLRKGER